MIERVEKSDYILVVHVLQESELAKRALGMGSCLKRTIKLLDGDLCVRDRVYGRATNNRIKSYSARVCFSLT